MTLTINWKQFYYILFLVIHQFGVYCILQIAGVRCIEQMVHVLRKRSMQRQRTAENSFHEFNFRGRSELKASKRILTIIFSLLNLNHRWIQPPGKDSVETVFQWITFIYLIQEFQRRQITPTFYSFTVFCENQELRLCGNLRCHKIANSHWV